MTKTKNAFNRWLDSFVEEKGFDIETRFEKLGPSGPNSIPLGCVIEAMKNAPDGEQAAIKTTLVKIDYRNGNALHFFSHLAGALAL